MILFFASGILAQDPAADPTKDPEFYTKVSYAIGHQMGKNFKKDDLEINMDYFFAGVTDAMQGTSKYDEAVLQKVMRDFQNVYRQRMAAKQEKALKKNLEEANAFLEKNKTNEGVMSTESGLQYKVLTAGTGRQPKASDKVKVHYKGTTLDGQEFDSSYKRGQPASFALNGVIKGWTEGVQLMKEGAKWTFYIPPGLAYGTRGSGAKIPPNAALIFEIELLEVLTPPATP